MTRRVPWFWLMAVVLAGPWGCGEERTPAVAMEDAGPSCVRGTQGCLCTLEDGCESGLLCLANRCLPLEGNSGGTTSDPVRPSPNGGSGSGAGGGSAGTGDSGNANGSDASTPDAAPGSSGGTDAAAPAPDSGTADSGPGDASL
jgi:hypothetical protein